METRSIIATTQATDYEQRREAIVNVAARPFAAGGFASTSVSELAAAAITSKSLIYLHYPSREGILHAVMASHINLLVTDVAEVMEAKAKPAERMSR